MPTENRRVATYLPPHIDERLESFKAERGIKGDSQAMLVILSEYFKVSPELAHSVAYDKSPELLEQIESRLLSRLKDELLNLKANIKSELSSELDSESDNQIRDLAQAVASMQAQIKELTLKPSEEGTLTTSQLAKRLKLDSSTVSHYKSRSAEDIVKQTQLKDPDNIGWEYLKSINRFRPVGELPSELQGKLFNV